MHQIPGANIDTAKLKHSSGWEGLELEGHGSGWPLDERKGSEGAVPGQIVKVRTTVMPEWCRVEEEEPVRSGNVGRSCRRDVAE
jgi:hypothetical protein